MKTAVQEVTFQLTTPDGEPASGGLLAAYPDGRYLTGQTRGGVVSLKLYRTDVQMTVLAAADGCLPFHADVTPGEAQNSHTGHPAFSRRQAGADLHAERA